MELYDDVPTDLMLGDVPTYLAVVCIEAPAAPPSGPEAPTRPNCTGSNGSYGFI